MVLLDKYEALVTVPLVTYEVIGFISTFMYFAFNIFADLSKNGVLIYGCKGEIIIIMHMRL